MARPQPRIRIIVSSDSSGSGCDSDCAPLQIDNADVPYADHEAVIPPADDSGAASLMKHSHQVGGTGLKIDLPVDGIMPGTKADNKSENLVDAAEDADDERPASTLLVSYAALLPKPSSKRRRSRSCKAMLVDLGEDSKFFILLGSALKCLENLELSQKTAFAKDVAALAQRVSALSSPAKPRSDLYGWRELFGLWADAEIFQGKSELDRGDHSLPEAASRLKRFVEQTESRKLAIRMKHRESRTALEHFVALNVQLLNLKRFQEANEQAAIKILQKHDIRTALTAANGFPSFINSLHHIVPDGEPRRLILPGLPALPRLLLLEFTTALLPIIPQIDDYSCGLCMEVVWKPILLRCGHRFCARCLVKMQKRGQDACPHCRAHVVLEANGANLDTALQSYLRQYFPQEVKRKAKEDERESAKEQLAEAGLDTRCAIS